MDSLTTKEQQIVDNSRCPKCGRKSLIIEKDGWVGAQPRIVCAFAGCAEVVHEVECMIQDAENNHAK